MDPPRASQGVIHRAGAARLIQCWYTLSLTQAKAGNYSAGETWLQWCHYETNNALGLRADPCPQWEKPMGDMVANF